MPRLFTTADKAATLAHLANYRRQPPQTLAEAEQALALAESELQNARRTGDPLAVNRAWTRRAKAVNDHEHVRRLSLSDEEREREDEEFNQNNSDYYN